MYLWSLLRKSDKELGKRVFITQSQIQSEDSWVSVVKRELQSCGVNMSFEEIAGLSKHHFKTLITKQIRLKSDEYFFPLQQSHSKTKNLVLGNKLKEYLVTPRLSLLEKQTLFN